MNPATCGNDERTRLRQLMVLPLSQAAVGHRIFEAQAHVGRIILTPEHS
jgi:hypothetical protein